VVLAAVLAAVFFEARAVVGVAFLVAIAAN
jgi:hypothetical protein